MTHLGFLALENWGRVQQLEQSAGYFSLLKSLDEVFFFLFFFFSFSFSLSFSYSPLPGPRTTMFESLGCLQKIGTELE